jgi:hypothetical protein
MYSILIGSIALEHRIYVLGYGASVLYSGVGSGAQYHGLYDTHLLCPRDFTVSLSTRLLFFILF